MPASAPVSPRWPKRIGSRRRAEFLRDQGSESPPDSAVGKAAEDKAVSGRGRRQEADREQGHQHAAQHVARIMSPQDDAGGPDRDGKDQGRPTPPGIEPGKSESEPEGDRGVA